MEIEDEGLKEVKIGSIIRPKEITQVKKPVSQIKKSRKECLEELNTIIEESKVILFVLDARVPSECRSSYFESKCSSQNKGLIFVLNKADLVPKEVLKKWKKELNKDHPTVTFSSIESNYEDVVKKIEEIKKGTKVGIIGYPNMGKKTLLERLNKSSIENLQLPKKVGTILSKQEPTSLIVKTVEDINDVGDPYVLVHALLKKIPKEKVLLKYEIPDYKTTQEFLEHTSRSKRLILKGGLTDYDKTAREVLADWIFGRIPFYQDC